MPFCLYIAVRNAVLTSRQPGLDANNSSSIMTLIPTISPTWAYYQTNVQIVLSWTKTDVHLYITLCIANTSGPYLPSLLFPVNAVVPEARREELLL